MIGVQDSFTLLIRSGAACALLSLSANAQVNLGTVRASSPNTTFHAYRANGGDRVPAFVRVPDSTRDAALAEGLIPLNGGLFGTYQPAADLSAKIASHPDWKWIWAPPRRTLLDRVIPGIKADVVRANYGLRGAGVIVGLIDTGLDLRHPDFRNAAGRTRVAWYLDLTQNEPLGVHPELEKAAGCTEKYTPCAVYNADDINRMLAAAQSPSTFPIDAIGHGTHVASLAAGNGLSNVPPKYVGVAPDADLVIVNASRNNVGDIQDVDIILGAKFVFQVASAQYLNEPAVVNLSLGGDAGAHDGTSTLEKELSALVGPEYPGRSIVVAAGNSAAMYQRSSSYPNPLGIHTSVQVLPDGNKTRVPVVVDASAKPDIDSRILVWVQSREGDTLSVGVDTESGECIAPIPQGAVVENRRCSGAEISLYNGLTEESDDPNGGSRERPAIAMTALGKFAKPSVYSLTFKGSGTAFVWVQSQDGLDPARGTLGALVPAATRERTIAIPASASELIAVGATLNRLDWKDVIGNTQRLKRFGAIATPAPGDVASFSGAGPNQLDEMKPDILAPGGYVIGAMASLADPRTDNGEMGMFDSTGACANSLTTLPQCPDRTNECVCYVADNFHGVAEGTSMASPIVAGAIALLLEKNPKLTQAQIRRTIQAGAQKLFNNAQLLTSAQEGPGVLDINGAIESIALEELHGNPESVSAGLSWLTVSSALVHPDDHWPTTGTVHLRDTNNKPVTLDASLVDIRLSPGFLIGNVRAEGYGYYTFEFTAGNGAGRQTMDLEVRVAGRRVLTDRLIVGVDIGSARGNVVGGRGCNIAKAPAKDGTALGLFAAAGAFGAALRRKRLRNR